MQPTRPIALLTLTAVAALTLIMPANYASAAECGAELIVDLVGSIDVAEISATGRRGCHEKPVAADAAPQPYSTYEVACSPDRLAAAQGLCSATPCPDFGRFFAFRTLHLPDGTSQPAGFRCVTLDQALATPGLTIAQVFQAIRQVKLPAGQIKAEPAIRGLANLTTYFWLQGTHQPPVTLAVGNASVHARFRVTEYQWDFGTGPPLITTGPGRPGLASEAHTSFPRRGFYRVGVTVRWAAEAWLDGRRVGQVDDLISQAQTTYPVAELQTILTG